MTHRLVRRWFEISLEKFLYMKNVQEYNETSETNPVYI